MLVAPEAFDANEQSFTASQEEEPAPPTPRFVVDKPVEGPRDPRVGNVLPQTTAENREVPPAEVTAPLASVQAELLVAPDPDSWRQEVASRVNSYRARAASTFTALSLIATEIRSAGAVVEPA